VAQPLDLSFEILNLGAAALCALGKGCGFWWFEVLKFSLPLLLTQQFSPACRDFVWPLEQPRSAAAPSAAEANPRGLQSLCENFEITPSAAEAALNLQHLRHG